MPKGSWDADVVVVPAKAALPEAEAFRPSAGATVLAYPSTSRAVRSKSASLNGLASQRVSRVRRRATRGRAR